jgi:glycosyltransferase involved in cell wall biosynthesis
MHGLVVDRVNERDLDLDCQALIQRIKTLWPRLLPFPDSLRRQHQQRDAFRISVIIPMFQESIDTMRETLNHALANCRGDAYQIQVIVVCADPDSSRPSTMKRLQTELHPSWGEFQVVALPAEQSGGGRGRTLNAGTPHSKAPVLTFLHADTLLPEGWDVTIEDALRMNETGVFVQACAFTMGIDMDGATASTTSGLRGAQWQGILRCHCGLPYGDSVLSFRKTTLEYLGGYPEQPLMEDFELMDWLRVRSMLLTGNDRKPTERLVLLDAQAKCSPRRWQKYGVAYTSLVNALCIYRYRYEGVMAEDLFSFYYHSANGGDSNCSKTIHSKKK